MLRAIFVTLILAGSIAPVISESTAFAQAAPAPPVNPPPVPGPDIGKTPSAPAPLPGPLGPDITVPPPPRMPSKKMEIPEVLPPCDKKKDKNCKS
jgi:hypothetical protein